MYRSSEQSALASVLSQRLARGSGTSFDLLDRNFKEQCDFILDPAKLKVAFCTRRAAKSYSGGILLVKAALETPGCNCLYLALTRENARGIMWKDVLKDINRKKELGAEFNEQRLTMTFPNGSIIYVAGADSDEEEMDKLLGKKYKAVVIDESQAWHVDMRRLVYGVLKPAVADYRGTICLLGTAGNITQGLFFDITRQDGKPVEPGWSQHGWTAYQNPYVASQWAEEIEEIRRTRPLFMQTPLYKQWYLNQWVIDTNKLVYWYKPGRNEYQILPRFTSGEWQHVLGVDLGYSPDPSAFSLVAFHDHDRTLYGIESSKKLEMDVTDVADKIKEYQARFPIFKVVIDGANKQAVEEMQRRHGIALTAADKRGKADFIQILNAEFVQELVKLAAVQNGDLIAEWERLVWRTEADKIVIPREEHPGLPNHCSDAFLYAWRYCYQFLSKAPAKPVNINNRDEWLAHTQKLHEEQLEREILRQSAEKNEEDFWKLSELDNEQDMLQHYLNKRRKK